MLTCIPIMPQEAGYQGVNPLIVFVSNTGRFTHRDFNHLFHHLIAAKFSVRLYLPDSIPDDLKAASPNELSVHDLPCKRIKPTLGGVFRTVYLAWRLGKQHPNAIFALITAQSHLLWGLPLRLMNRRTIFLMTGMGTLFSSTRLKYRLARGAVKALYRYFYSGRNSRVIVHNKDDLAYVIDKLGVHREKAFLTSGPGRSAVEFPFFATLPQNAKKIILVASRNIVEKGIFEAAAASDILRSRGIDHEMWFTWGVDAGNPLPVRSRDLTDMQSENRAVRFLGFVPSMVPLYEACDIVCVPSYREGLPTAAVEASACGRPIVTTDAIGCRDIVSHEKTGLVVPVRSTVELADALARLLGDRALAERLRQNAYKQFQERFTNERAINETLTAFRSVGLPC
jgi:glycosyltransferase involved in cell wall biosynthesis